MHGLNGDKLGTWTPTGDSEAFWPDWFAEDIPGTAVWSLGYPASASHWQREGSAMALPDRAANVLPALLSAVGPTTGDIIFVGYSLGGLVIQSTLRRAEMLAPHDAQIAAFLRRVRGFILLGTPSSGSNHATVGNIFSVLLRPRETLRDLKRDNPYLRDLNMWFRSFVPKSNIKALVIREHKPVRRWGVIVPPSSADPGLPVSTPIIPVDEDHVSLSHPASKESDVYRHIADFLSSPLQGPHPDTLIVEGVKEVQDTVREIQSDVEATASRMLAGQRSVERVLERFSAENLVVTRDAERRLTRLRQARFAVGFNPKEECERLLKASERGELASAANAVRQSIFAWCARILVTVDYSAAESACAKAEEFGKSDETIIARAFLRAYATNGDKSEALATLAHLGTPESYTASLIVKAHNETPDVPLKWLEEAGLRLAQFDPDGKFRIIGLQLISGAWCSALESVEALSATDLKHTPCLLISSAIAYLGQAVHEDMRQAIMDYLPEQLEDFPLGEDSAAIGFRTKALLLFEKAAIALESLGLDKAAAMAADRALWLALRDPASHAEARNKLEASMGDRKIRLRRLPMALAFGLTLDMQAVEREIDSETAMSGGKSIEAAIARFAVTLKRKTPEVAEYIERHRQQLIQYYTPDYIDSIAIEALVKASRINDARTMLAELIARGAEDHIVSFLTGVINESAGADTIARRENEYAAQPTVQKLINLVDELKRKKDSPKLADYARKLFEAVKDTASAEVYTSALYEVHADDKIAELAQNYPEIVRGSGTLGTTVSWAYYRLGRLKEAREILESLQASRDIQNDRYLYMNIAIASGDWSALNGFVESEWAHREKREAAELLRAGVLAQRVGSSARSQELVRAAAARANNDPGILIGCYSAATSAGWENEEAIHGWMAAAFDASGEDGTVRQMDIQEMLDLQPGWNERVDRTSDLLLRGEAPMFVAAKVVNRTLLDLYLRPALRNLSEGDPRKRHPIFGFGGSKPIQKIPGRRVAIDITGLLTLTLSGQLSSVLMWCDKISIAHTTLGWLFEERDRLAFHQPSQVRRAREVKRLIDLGQLHRFESTAPPPAIEQKFGDNIARYLVAAKTIDTTDTSQRIVVRPYPLPKAGTLLKEYADITGFEDNLVGCMDVIRALKKLAHVTNAEESNAAAYLGLHEKPWPHNPNVQPGATLYLDDLAVSYFQHIGLLGRLSQAGFRVFVSLSEVDRANELVEFDIAGDEARRMVEDLQAKLRDGIVSGKVVLGRLLPTGDEDDSFDAHPSRLMIASEFDVDVVVVDDRFFNRFGTMGKTPLATSLDLLAAMVDSGATSRACLTQTMTLLRQGGFVLVPNLRSEILGLLNAAFVAEGILQETAELRAIRESITRVRMTDVLQLPSEAAWIDELGRELLIALRAQWTDDISDSDARARANWAIKLLDARGWSHRSAPTGLGGLERYRDQVMVLLMHSSTTPPARDRYWQWLEEMILEDFKNEQSSSYERLVANLGETIDNQVRKPSEEEPDE